MLCLALLGLPAVGQAQEAAEKPAAVEASAPDAAVPKAKPAVADSAQDKDAKLPKLVFNSKMLYQILLAEIAGNRGNIPLATTLYSDLAKTTRDPRIARRATEVAIYARQTALALEAARIWVQTEPDSAAARQALAGLLLNAKQNDEAISHLSKLLSMPLPQPQPDTAEAEALRKSQPANAVLVMRLEQIYRLLSRHQDKAAAQQIIDQLTAPYEKVAEAQFTRAQAAADAKDEPHALLAIDRALALRPDWEQAVLFKAQLQQRVSSTLAEQTLKAFLADHPKASEVRIAYARSLIGDKHYEAARREFNILLDDNRDNGEVLYAVALLSMQLNDLPAAEKHLKRLLDLGIGNPNLLRYYLGQVAEESKRPDDALGWYTKVTPGEQYLPALARAATMLAKNGRIEEGRALLQKAGTETPQERIQLLIAESQLLVNANRTADAYDLLDGQLAGQPEQPELLYETALLAEKLDRLDVMERNLRRLIRVKPDDAHAYNALGYSLADHGLRLDEAQQLIEKGLALAPDDAFILDSKGWLLYRRGAKVEALEVLRKAYGVRPDAEIAAHLGEVLWVSGQQDEARKTWSESAKSNPGNVLLGETMKKFTGAEKPAKDATAVQPAPDAPPKPAAE